MLAISIGLVSHSYVLTSLFPYVGYMVQHLGVTDDKDEAGQFSLETSVGKKRNWSAITRVKERQRVNYLSWRTGKCSSK